MSKRACKNAKITLGGSDISAYVKAFNFSTQVGELYLLTLTVQDEDNWLEIIDDPSPVTTDAKILVNGVDISSHVRGYERQFWAGKADTVKLYLIADENVMTINGTTPWVEEA